MSQNGKVKKRHNDQPTDDERDKERGNLKAFGVASPSRVRVKSSLELRGRYRTLYRFDPSRLVRSDSSFKVQKIRIFRSTKYDGVTAAEEPSTVGRRGSNSEFGGSTSRKPSRYEWGSRESKVGIEEAVFLWNRVCGLVNRGSL